MKILVIDNYDSFTFNLVQLIGKFTDNIIVERCDEFDTNRITQNNFDKILISPGPGHPKDALTSLKIIKEYQSKIPILGVCLGFQCFSLLYGGVISKDANPKHGKVSFISHDGKGIFKSIPQNFEAMRYHSLIIENSFHHDEIEISAKSDDGIIMGIRHKTFPVEGMQFHPESILSQYGELLIQNWLEL